MIIILIQTAWFLMLKEKIRSIHFIRINNFRVLRILIIHT